jgi:uncharacterized tellurite resistance protein B-like protein
MDILSRLFSSSANYSPGSIKNLILMANVDGDYHVSENFFLESLADEKKISAEKLKDIINNLSRVHYELPEDKNQRYEQLYQAIKMMMADSRIKDEELLFCTEIARALDFKSEVTDKLITSIQASIMEGLDEAATKVRIASLLEFNS